MSILIWIILGVLNYGRLRLREGIIAPIGLVMTALATKLVCLEVTVAGLIVSTRM